MNILYQQVIKQDAKDTIHFIYAKTRQKLIKV